MVHGVPLEVLINFNGIIHGEIAIRQGNILVIPLCYPTPENVGYSTTPTPLPIVDIFPACQEIKLEVQQGDTLNTISANYAIPKDHIKQYNHMETDEVFPGMALLFQICSNMPTPTETSIK